ncbi:MAG: FAD/NAD(P)-binding oxidoreductase [Candidatus Cloacimonadota bacterium]|nr:MAG: FAD/NAD(P)-binding oxidoreductase [Candidatus Cloacimonadota bacterium]
MKNKNKVYDFIIIGAGVIGCNIARELAKYNVDILVIEKEDDVASEISKGNSGVLHAGFYQPQNTLKAKTNVRGLSCFKKLSEELNFEMRINEKLVIAMNDEEQKHLEHLYEQGKKNGVKGLRLICEQEIKRIEPNVNGKYALHSYNSAIIEPYKFTIALAENACQNGVKFLFNEAVIGIDKLDSIFRVRTSNNNIHSSRWVINCAGMYSDDVSELVADTEYKIHPCKGEYYITDKVEDLFQRMIYPVPPTNGSSLGIHFTPTIEHNVLIGPSAEYIDEKSDTSNTANAMKNLKTEIYKYIPKLANVDFIRNYAGIRPKLISGKDDKKFADFVIEENKKVDHFIDLIGIESPGLTSAPAIAEIVIDIIGNKEDLEYNKTFNPHREKSIRFATLPLDEQAKLIEQNEEYGIIVCRCETVTQAEIINTIENPLGVRSLDAIKRRCRSMMGRCQGGFCTPRIVEILIDRYGLKPEEIYKNNKESNLFYGLIKD